MAKIKVTQLTDQQRLQLEEGFLQGKSHAYRMRCRAVLPKANGLTSKEVGVQTEMSHISVNSWVKRFASEGVKGLETRPPGTEANHGQLGRGSCTHCHRERQAECNEGEGSLAASIRQGGEREAPSGLFYPHWREI